MAIKKQFLKSKPVCKVTFLFNDKTADSVSVVGSFNNWDTEHTILKKLKNGSFKGTVDLSTKTKHEYRYFVDGTYLNQDDADSYIWNDYACDENSVLAL